MIQRLISAFLRPRLRNGATFTWNGYDLFISKDTDSPYWKATVIRPRRRKSLHEPD